VEESRMKASGICHGGRQKGITPSLKTTTIACLVHVLRMLRLAIIISEIIITEIPEYIFYKWPNILYRLI